MIVILADDLVKNSAARIVRYKYYCIEGKFDSTTTSTALAI